MRVVKFIGWAKALNPAKYLRASSGRQAAALSPPWTGLASAGVLFLALTLAGAYPASAGCDLDCDNEYQSAVADCRAGYEQGSRNVEELESCSRDARDEYDDCLDQCDRSGADGVIGLCYPPSQVDRG